METRGSNDKAIEALPHIETSYAASAPLRMTTVKGDQRILVAKSMASAPPHGRDKSGPYGLDIASLVVFWHFATGIKFEEYAQ